MRHRYSSDTNVNVGREAEMTTRRKMAMKGHPLTNNEAAVRDHKPLPAVSEPIGRVITCRDCGESGTRAGGLQKVGDDYLCNNRKACAILTRQKTLLMGQRKVK